MAASNHTVNESATAQTGCTNCGTVFEIPQELLASQDTRVRCGECLCIFNAMDDLRFPSPEDDEQNRLDAVVASLPEPVGNDLDVTYSDFDLFSDDADLPEIAYLNETSDPVDLDFDAVESDNDSTFSDTIFKHDVTINADLPMQAEQAEPTHTGVAIELEAAEKPTGPEEAGATADNEHTEDIIDVEGPESRNIELDALPGTISADIAFDNTENGVVEPLVFSYREEAYPSESGSAGSSGSISLPNDLSDTFNTPTAEPLLLDPPKQDQLRHRRWILGAGLAAVLLTVLASLYVYRERDQLVNNTQTRPFMSAVCWLLRCDLPVRFDKSELKVLARHVYSHPDVEGALVINVVFSNTAAFEQRYPVLVVNLTDITGRLVASRDFAPVEYLTDTLRSQSETLVAGMSVDVTLEIQDPGPDASSFTMDFR